MIWIIVPVYCLQCFTKFIKYLCFIAIFLWIFIWIKYKEIPKMTITSCLHERYNFGRKNVWSACMHLCRQRSVVLMTWRGKKRAHLVFDFAQNMLLLQTLGIFNIIVYLVKIRKEMQITHVKRVLID